VPIPNSHSITFVGEEEEEIMRMENLNISTFLSIKFSFYSQFGYDMSSCQLECAVSVPIMGMRNFFPEAKKKFLGCAVNFRDTPGISRSMSSLLAILAFPSIARTLGGFSFPCALC
jgi:hypothetical protein